MRWKEKTVHRSSGNIVQLPELSLYTRDLDSWCIFDVNRLTLVVMATDQAIDDVVRRLTQSSFSLEKCSREAVETNDRRKIYHATVMERGRRPLDLRNGCGCAVVGVELGTRHNQTSKVEARK